MVLIRFIILAVVIWIIYMMVKRLIAGNADTEQKTTKPLEDMQQCKYCGMHVPQTEAIENNGDYFCSKQHLKQHQEEPH